MAFPTNANQVQAFAGALYGLQIGSVTMAQVTSDIQAAGGLTKALNSYYQYSFGSVSTATVAASFAANLGLTGTALTAGTSYVTARLNAAAASDRGAVIVDILNLFAGLSSDATYGAAATAWNTKVDAASAYTGTSNVTIGTTTAVQGGNFSLTANVDTGTNFTGNAGDDVFNAALTTGGLNTLGNLDSLVGGSGNDTLNAEATGSATITPLSLSGIENVVVNFAGSTPTVGLANAAALTSVTAQTSAVNGIFTGIAAGATLNVADQAANVSFGYAVTTGTQSATLNVKNVTSNSVITIAGIETITVNSTGSANAIDLTATSATTLNVTGDKNLTLDDLGTSAHADALTSINAASFTGALDMGVAGVAIVSITGGSGNDKIYGTASVANAIAGNSGNDTITMAANLTSADTIGGGDGTDILSVSGGSGDTAFTYITSVETLTLTSGGATTTLGAAAQAAGIVTINGSTASEIITATAYTVGLTFNGLDSSAATDSVTLGSGDDVFVYAGNLLLSSDDSLNGGAGTDTVRIDNSAGSVSISVNFATFLNIEQIVVNDTNGSATSTAESINITLTAASVTSGTVGISTISVDGSAIADASDSMNFTATGITTTSGLKVSVLGGAGNDSIVGSSNADTITGNAGNDSINGGSGADSITGGDGNDTIDGETGSDVITGGAGNDSITAGDGNDNLNGGEGSDSFIFAANLASADTIGGGDGTDILSVSGGSADSAFTNITSVETLTLTSGGATTTLGTAAQAAGIVTINGSTASEIITATAYTVGLTFNGLDSSAATDSVTLGSGDDIFVYAGNLLLSSDDSLNGGAGTDTVRIDNSAGSVSISVNFATFLNIEQIVVNDTNGSATSTAESINITLTAASVTSGTVGISTISVDGSAIADASDSMNFTATGITTTSGLKVSVLGGAGNDTIVGSSNADTITGNAGNDSINGGSGADSITGGDGNDTIDGETGNDVITGGAGNDSITAAAGNDNLNGGEGSDTLIIADNLTYQDTIAGGDGVDILSVSNATVSDIDLLNVSGIETLTLASAGTTVTLGAYAQAAGITIINGHTGNDIISATAYTVGLTFNGLDSSAATDSVTLGTGDDIFVYAGNLLLSSDDSLNGGAGTDTVRIDNSAGSVSISVNFAKFVNIEQIVIYDSNGTATGTAESINITLTVASVTTGAIGISTILVDGSAITDAADSMNFTAAGMVVATNGLKVSVLGGAGNDTIIGSTGADTISGGDGNDSLTGGSGADSITGGNGTDALIGQTGNDVLIGNDGNDTLTGATGNDTLTGGAGNDTFAMGVAGTTKLVYDTITDLGVGDILSFTGAVGSASTTFTSTALSTTNLSWTELVNIAASGDGSVTANFSWFSWGGNTYVVQDYSSATSFVDGTDIIVEITGIVNLQASFAATSAAATTIVIS